MNRDERLGLGSGGRGRDNGGVSRGWKTLNEDGQGHFADDLKTEKGGGGGEEMVMNDGVSFVWGWQGFRGAEGRSGSGRSRSRPTEISNKSRGHQQTSRVSIFYAPSPPKLYAA